MGSVKNSDPPQAGGLGTSITAAMQKASAHERATHEKDVRDKVLKLTTDVYGRAAAYDNVVIVAGYVAFFALWTGVSKDVSRLCRLSTVALMSVSLMLYLLWHIIQMLTRQTYEWKLGHTFKIADDPVRFNRQYAEIVRQQELAEGKMMRLWLPIFVPAVAFGFAAGALLSYNALAMIFGGQRLSN